MTKPIEISHRQYENLLTQLRKDYPPSATLVRSKMKEKLGFTPREYKDWDKDLNRYAKYCIMLDFYSEKKRTWFIMKYSEFIKSDRKDDF